MTDTSGWQDRQASAAEAVAQFGLVDSAGTAATVAVARAIQSLMVVERPAWDRSPSLHRDTASVALHPRNLAP